MILIQRLGVPNGSDCKDTALFAMQCLRACRSCPSTGRLATISLQEISSIKPPCFSCVCPPPLLLILSATMINYSAPLCSCARNYQRVGSFRPIWRPRLCDFSRSEGPPRDMMIFALMVMRPRPQVDDAACLRSKCIRAIHCHGARSVYQGNERRPVSSHHLHLLQGAAPGFHTEPQVTFIQGHHVRIMSELQHMPYLTVTMK